jgi:hypothetical protein
MGMLCAVGPKMNLLKRGVVTMTPAAAALYPAGKLFDGQPGFPSVFGSAGTDGFIQVDLNELLNGGFETTTLANWSDDDLGTGTSVDTTTGSEVRTGTHACKMTGTNGSNYGARGQTILVTPGEKRRNATWVKALATGVGKLYLQNLDTGRWFNGTTWQASKTHAVQITNPASFTEMGVNYTVESFKICGKRTQVQLRVTYACESGTVSFDDCTDHAAVDILALLGTNVAPAIAPTLQSSDDASSWTDRAVLSPMKPAFWAYLTTPIYTRHWRAPKFIGTPTSAIYVGEAVLAQTRPWTSLAPNISYGDERDYRQTRHAGAIGDIYRNLVSDSAPSSFDLSFEPNSDAERDELEELYDLAQGGAVDALIVPDNSRTEIAFGPIDMRLRRNRQTWSVDGADVSIVSLGHPVVGL